METIKYEVTIPENHTLTVRVPDHITPNQVAEVIVTIGQTEQTLEERINTLKAAMHDPLFLSDLKEVADDFAVLDPKDWERQDAV
jgi:hypothetical protein